jgi:rhodanese-related sulfurtransferase
MLEEEALLVDVRETGEFSEIRIPGAVNLPASEIVDRWQEIPADQVVVFCCRSGHRSGLGVSILRARANYQQFYNLDGGIHAWFADGLPVDTAPAAPTPPRKAAPFEEIGVEEAARRLEQGWALVDVRETDEFAHEHAPGAIHLPLDEISDNLPRLRKLGSLMLICDAGIRSDVAAVYLVGQGFERVANVKQGLIAWRRRRLPWIAPDF